LISLGVAKLYYPEMRNFLATIKESSADILEIGFASTVPDAFPRSFVELARSLHLRLSCHLPFSINIGGETDKSRSVTYLAKGLRIANLLGGLAVFHPGFYRGQSFEVLRNNLLDTIRRTLSQVPSGEGILGIETTGRTTEIGTIEEILYLVKEIDNKLLVPVIDWAHIYARRHGESPRTVRAFNDILDRVAEELAPERLYFHMSGIEYGVGGERRHTSVRTCAPPLPYLAYALEQKSMDFQMILESPDPIGDLDWARRVLENPQEWFKYVEERQRKSEMSLMDAYF
jgi:deoxyribonuclease-4